MKSILLLLIITLLGCSSNMKQEPISKSGIPVINLSEDVSTVPSLLLSESAEKLEIVPLEMTDQSMLGEIRRIQVTEHDIWIHDFNKFYIYTRVRDKDCVKNRVKRAKIVRFTLC